MARDHARLSLHIWTDTDFQPLSTPAKLLYLFLVSQPKLSYAGVLDLAVKRWARAHPDLGFDGVRAALGELDAAEFVVIDHDHEELLVRSFVRNDELWKQPNVLRAALRVAFDIESTMLRRALAAELRRLPVEVTGPAPTVAADELEAGARELPPSVKAAFTVRGSARAVVDHPAPPTPPLATGPADALTSETVEAERSPWSEPPPTPSGNPSPIPSAMDLGEGSRERGTSRGPVPVDRKVGVPAPASPPAREGTHACEAPGSRRAVRRVEADRLVAVHVPALPGRVLARLRGEVIGLLAEQVPAAAVAAGLREWSGKRLPVTWLPELVGEHQRAALTTAPAAERRRAVVAAEGFERLRADAVADDDRSPVGLAVRGELPTHATPADLDALLVAALDQAAQGELVGVGA
ncbi:Phage protein [Alloactinosynnema sp. L-07]|uniref:hypothetical protein n=1 Tax=Alloactinosynnema sp. L-07 TaxID=1653480 RepID=UPI00065F00DD|nr:hypothetical protein [Alloactinosynnema sp. L-07]CRK55458.1 Phage protein [Alloactinosynnema sp. L-07]